MRFLPAVFAVSIALSLFACSSTSEEEYKTLAQKYEDEEDFKQALATYEEMLDDYPNGRYAPETIQKTAFIHYNSNHDFAKAIEYHKLLTERFPDSQYAAQASFMTGFIYANDLRDYDVARHIYNEFLEKYPEHELVESVKWELQHLGKDVNEQLTELFEKQSNGETKDK
jgi:outer membrane protein assembly factor BamD (BamD/ComL family)